MHTNSLARKGGYSLVEVLIALSISVVIGGVSMLFISEGMRYSLRTAASADNDFVQWSVSSRLQLDSKLANGAVIYPDLTAASLKASLRRLGGQRGKVLVLSSSQRDAGAAQSRFTNLTGYWYDDSNHVLLKFDHAVSSSQQASYADLETILVSNLDSFTFTPVATGVESLDANGPFVSRDVGNINAATATFKVERGSDSNHTGDTSVVEVSFLIR